MNHSVYEEANGIARYVNGKILRLQEQYVGKEASASSARASLARLRRLDGTSGDPWIVVGEEVFSDFPNVNDQSPQVEKKMLDTVKATLQLYAIHQQSQTDKMAFDSRSQNQNFKRSFGWSCREFVKRSKKNEAGVRRRMEAVEASDDLDGITYNLRSLIRLLRSEKICVDYYLLAKDLYLLQFEKTRAEVFMRWSKDYYTYSTKPSADSGTDDKTADTLMAE